MNAEKFLSTYRNAIDHVEIIRAEVEKLRDELDCIKSASDNDGMPRGTKTTRPTEEKAIRIADKLLTQIEAEEKAAEIRAEVTDAILELESPGCLALYKYYIQLKNWDVVADEMGYSLRHIYRIRDNAMQSLKRDI